MKTSAIFDLIDPELWVVTSAAQGSRGGLLATWVMQAAIDRDAPVVIAGLAPNHFTTQLVRRGGVFAIHLLDEHQVDLAWNFACDSGRNRDKFASVKLLEAEDSQYPPILADAAAYAICRVICEHDVGDRVLFHANVTTSSIRKKQQVLRQRGFINALSVERREVLKQDLTRDVALQRPLRAAWLQGIRK